MKKLIAIDGNSLMFRAYYALPSMSAKDGTPTGAVYGFISMLLKLLPREPDYMVVAFDMHGGTFRHDVFSEYKAGRRETPDDLRTQMPIIKELLAKMGIAVCECFRYEADDILGTFARISSERGVDALLVTGDRDALQLIGEHTRVMLTKKGISETAEYDEAVLMEQYGLTPERMVDLKGLMGDNSDNIPGIPGVGEKTALKLLAKYGSMEAVLARAEEEKGALREKLLSYADSARMSYELGKINLNAPITATLDDCVFIPSSLSGGIPLMNALELRSLVSRFPQGEAQRSEAHTEAVTERIDNEEALSALAGKLTKAGRVSVYMDNTLMIATEPDREYEIVLGATLLESGLSAECVLRALKPMLEDESIKKTVFDIKSLKRRLVKDGLHLAGADTDVMIADYLLHAIHPADSLKTLAAERTGAKPGAALLLEIGRSMTEELSQKGLKQLYDEIELPLIDVLYDMEQTGFRVDEEMLSSLSAQFASRLNELEEAIYVHAGERFNILSPKQLGVILFEKLELPTGKKTKSGYSTDSEVLEGLSGLHPIVDCVTEYRFLSKLKSTFLDALIVQTASGSGRVHTTLNQNVTATGRISSTDPNLQNIPVRTELGREIRKAFTASEGNVLVGADYSQIELRLLAHMSADTVMRAAFIDGDDIHARTASEVFAVPLSEVTAEQRSAAKAVNFGIVYGISDFGLSRNLGISRKRAKEYIELYLDRYTGVREYMQSSVETARAKGYAATLLGRRRELPELRSSNYNTRAFGERVAMNMPIQGTAADIIKLAMVRVHQRLLHEGLSAKLVLQVHDELIIDAPEAEEDAVKAILSDCMENAMQLSVPLRADVRSGKSWFDTK